MNETEFNDFVCKLRPLDRYSYISYSNPGKVTLDDEYTEEELVKILDALRLVKAEWEKVNEKEK